MSSKDDMKLFVSEAEDLINKTEDEILNIEENPDDLKPVEGLFFTFHTLKGLTAMAGFDNLSKFCHHFESFLQNAKDKKVALSKTSNFIDMLFESLEVLKSVIKRVKSGDLTDIDGKFVEDIRDSFESFESDYDITFIHPLTQEEIANILRQKQNKSFKIYIRLEETCVFKKVRLFIIFRALNVNGKICWTHPAPEALEKATLKNEFEIYYITTKNKTEISHTLDEILEIENLVITPQKPEEFKKIITDLQEKWEQEKPEDVSIESRYEVDHEGDFVDEEVERVSQIVDDFSGETVKITSVKVNVEYLEELMNYFGELVIMKNHINQLLKEKQDRTIARLIDKMDKPFLDIQEILSG